MADKDGGGTVSIAELTKFVWGNENLLHEPVSTEHAAAGGSETGLYQSFSLASPVAGALDDSLARATSAF